MLTDLNFSKSISPTEMRTASGTSYSLSFETKTSKRPAKFLLAVPSICDIDFRIIRKTWFDRLGKSMGWYREISTGNRQFDESYYISTSGDFSAIERFFQLREVQEQVEKIFQLGFQEIKQAKLSLEVQLINGDPGALLPSVEFVVEALSSLAAIERNRGDLSFRRSSKGAYFTLLTLSIVSLILGVISVGVMNSYFPVLDVWNLFFYSLTYAVVAFLGAVLICSMMLRNRTSTHRECAIIFPFAAISCVLLAYSVLVWENATYDTSVPQTHICAFLSKYKNHTKHGYNYYVTVSSWRPGHTSEKFQVTGNIYSSLSEKNSDLNVETRSGYLGFEWITNRNF